MALHNLLKQSIVVALSEIARCQEPVADVCLETLLEITVLAPHLVALSDGYKVWYGMVWSGSILKATYINAIIRDTIQYNAIT